MSETHTQIFEAKGHSFRRNAGDVFPLLGMCCAHCGVTFRAFQVNPEVCAPRPTFTKKEEVELPKIGTNKNDATTVPGSGYEFKAAPVSPFVYVESYDEYAWRIEAPTLAGLMELKETIEAQYKEKHGKEA